MDLIGMQKSIGQKLRKLREDKKMTISKVAELVQKSSSQLGSIERGDRCVSLPSLLGLAEFYQVPIAYLFEDDLQQYHRQIGRFLQDYLNSKSLTLSDLANQTDINYFHLAEFFNGRTSLDLAQLKNIAHVLGIATAQLVPQLVRYTILVKYYLKAMGLDACSIQTIEDYIYSRIDSTPS